MIPGQKMDHRVTEALDRADPIAYLKEISPL
jgi:cytochrome c2